METLPEHQEGNMFGKATQRPSYQAKVHVMGADMSGMFSSFGANLKAIQRSYLMGHMHNIYYYQDPDLAERVKPQTNYEVANMYDLAGRKRKSVKKVTDEDVDLDAEKYLEEVMAQRGSSQHRRGSSLTTLPEQDFEIYDSSTQPQVL